MIAISQEKLLSFALAGRLLGEHLSTGPVHEDTIRRWATSGLRGVVLASAFVGGRRYTSEASLQAFCEALTSRRGQTAASLSSAIDDDRTINSRRAAEAAKRVRAFGPQGRSRYQRTSIGGTERERDAREASEDAGAAPPRANG